jgi:UDP-2,4-diacetamido-2,4,6-trideoxy-beta-L-altropyranose hydrolase
LKKKIIIRADGGSTIGMGHIVRTLALADMLKTAFQICFAIQRPASSVLELIRAVTSQIIQLPITPDFDADAHHFASHVTAADIVVLDGYHFDTAYQKEIRRIGCKIVCIDDLHAWQHCADAIINHAEGIDPFSYSTAGYTKLYLGLKYALLRGPFLQQQRSRTIGAVKKIFISMGAADFDNNTCKYIQALLLLDSSVEIQLMLSDINPHLSEIKRLIEKNSCIHAHFNMDASALAKLLYECDLAIVPASTISLECCAIGIGIVSGFTAENQLGILGGLEQKKVLINSGNMNYLSVEQVHDQLREIISKPILLNEQLIHQKKLIDGKSPERLLEIFKELSVPVIHFRFAASKDVDLYFEWANDPVVRKNAFNQQTISYDDHVKWFSSKVNDPRYSFYLFFDEQKNPIGQVRIDSDDQLTQIGVSIAPDFRGKSLSHVIISMACTDYLNRFPDKIIYSYIKIENKPSYFAFKKANFIEMGQEIVKGDHVFKLYLGKNS